MAELINEKDSLNKGRVKINNSIKDSNTAKESAIQALARSLSAEQIAQLAELKSNETQQQLDNIIIHSGTSDAEVIQARNTYPVLNDRLNANETQLVETSNLITEQTKRLKIGEIYFPSDFKTFPFSIFKVSEQAFTHNATPQNQHDWSKATEVFIHGYNPGTGDGTNYTSPISFRSFYNRYNDGAYNGQKDFILTIVTNHVGKVGSPIKLTDLPINILIKSGSIKGISTVGVVRDSEIAGIGIVEGFTSFEGVYRAEVEGTASIDYPLNFKRVDEYGLPFVYEEMDNLIDCKEKKGSFYTQGSEIYVNPFIGESIKDIRIARSDRVLPIEVNNNNKIMFENIVFLSDALTVNNKSVDSETYFFKCGFYRGRQDSLAIQGAYRAYVLDCYGSHATKDIFNYHSTTPESFAVEVSCVGYGAGKYKLIGGNITTGSNNGSTAHDGMYMLRVGSQYSECEGPIVADIQDCYSISIGCGSWDVLETNTGVSAGFYVHSVDDSPENNKKPKYIIECQQAGKHFRRGLHVINSTQVYYQNFIGGGVSELAEPIEWEDVAND